MAHLSITASLGSFSEGEGGVKKGSNGVNRDGLILALLAVKTERHSICQNSK